MNIKPIYRNLIIAAIAAVVVFASIHFIPDWAVSLVCGVIVFFVAGNNLKSNV